MSVPEHEKPPKDAVTPVPVPPDVDDDPRGPLEKPGLVAALVLLLPAAAGAGMFYLWLRKWPESLAYGGLIGAGVAAMGAEFVKLFRSHREEGSQQSALGEIWVLARASFSLGFIQTFTMVVKELFKLAGLKLLVSMAIAAIAFFVARASHLF